MIATPIRWLLMIGVAASGYFMITGSSMDTRAFAFIGSVVCWQAYYVTMMYEADIIASRGRRGREGGQAAPGGLIAQSGAQACQANGAEPSLK